MPDEKFTRRERINDSLLVRRIRTKGKALKTGQLSLFRLENRLDRPRLVLMLTKKTGLSPVRNRSRRLIREFFRKNKKVLGGWDYLFFSDRDLSLLSRGDWHEMFQSILNWCRQAIPKGEGPVKQHARM